MPTLKLIPNRCDVPVVMLRIAGVEYNFLIDTGATRSLLAPELVSVLVPRRETRHTIHGGTQITCHEVKQGFRFAGAMLYSIDCRNTDYLSQMFNLHTKCGGIIGCDILRQFANVVFDYKTNTVRFEL